MLNKLLNQNFEERLKGLEPPKTQVNTLDIIWRRDVQRFDTSNFRPIFMGDVVRDEDITIIMNKLKGAKHYSMHGYGRFWKILNIVFLATMALLFLIYFSAFRGFVSRNNWAIPLLFGSPIIFIVLLLGLDGHYCSRNMGFRHNEFEEILAQLNKKSFLKRGFSVSSEKQSAVIRICKKPNTPS